MLRTPHEKLTRHFILPWIRVPSSFFYISIINICTRYNSKENVFHILSRQSRKYKTRAVMYDNNRLPVHKSISSLHAYCIYIFVLIIVIFNRLLLAFLYKLLSLYICGSQITVIIQLYCLQTFHIWEILLPFLITV